MMTSLSRHTYLPAQQEILLILFITLCLARGINSQNRGMLAGHIWKPQLTYKVLVVALEGSVFERQETSIGVQTNMKILTFLLIIIVVSLSAPSPVYDVIPTSTMEEAQRENINLIRSQTRSFLREWFRQQFRKKIHPTQWRLEHNTTVIMCFSLYIYFIIEK